MAFGAPGSPPGWTSSAKEGIGTAYHTSCRVWFTLSHGIVNEIYYPNVDQPNTRDFQFLITDGETFCHEEKRDLTHQVEYPDRNAPLHRLTNSEPQGRYRLVKHVLTHPHGSVLLVHTKLEVLDESLRGKLKLYALLAIFLPQNWVVIHRLNSHSRGSATSDGRDATFVSRSSRTHLANNLPKPANQKLYEPC